MNLRRRLLVLALLLVGLLGTATAAETADTVTILARDNLFDPKFAAAATGDTIVWKNVGEVSHTVTAADGSFDAVLRAGQTYQRVFSKPGEVNYYCRFHGTQDGGGMAGTLTVTGTTARAKDRIAGDGRIQTAVELSKYQWPDGADEVYLSRSDVNPDALVAGALTRGPILLVPACGDLPAEVKAEIDRLDPVKVVALGGANAVCESILDQAVTR